ncbi:MAG: uracil-DNA glycosylase [Longimicrobiales bacterium]|nr:uracil-DNA glycosylase [Longimicrobiales bacterium]
MSLPGVPEGWPELRSERERAYFEELESFLEQERERRRVYPPREEVFRALELTPREAVRVVLLGQDPYHGPGQAHGLAFSVRPGVAKPPSLRNLLQELHEDLGVSMPEDGDLTPWARRGVLLLNAVLTVREGAPGSHRGKGWETFTDAVVEAASRGGDPVVFMLLGNRAREKAGGVDDDRHGVIEVPHPSPLSAYRGFFGSRVFSRTNALLEALGREPVDWSLG